VLSLSGCTGAPTHMRLSPEVASIVPQLVQGHTGGSHSLSFGRWSVTTPARFTTDEVSIGGDAPGAGRARVDERVSVGKRVSRFQFALDSQPPGSAWSASCESEQRFAAHVVESRKATDETEVTQPGFPNLRCEISGPQGTTGTGVLSLRADYTTQRDSGTAKLGRQEWQVRSVNYSEKQSLKIPLEDAQAVVAIALLYYAEMLVMQDA
jgi:hypothetical protein